jgi:hypothetical protein
MRCEELLSLNLNKSLAAKIFTKYAHAWLSICTRVRQMTLPLQQLSRSERNSEVKSDWDVHVHLKRFTSTHCRVHVRLSLTTRLALADRMNQKPAVVERIAPTLRARIPFSLIRHAPFPSASLQLWMPSRALNPSSPVPLCSIPMGQAKSTAIATLSELPAELASLSPLLPRFNHFQCSKLRSASVSVWESAS